jgi:hypothetical protein
MRPSREIKKISGVENDHFDVSGILETWKFAHEHVSRTRAVLLITITVFLRPRARLTLTNHGHGFYPATITATITSLVRAPANPVK